MLFCSARQGICSYSPDELGTDLKPLFDTILEYIPAPQAEVDKPFQMLVSSIDYNDFVGRIAIGRIEQGTLRQNQEISVCNFHAPEAELRKAKATSIFEFEGLKRVPVTEATAGNIVAMSGIPDITIGDTICAPNFVEALPFVKISKPTMEMTFSINDSPYAGREGKYVTSRNLRDRLFKETLKDVSLRVSELPGSTDSLQRGGPRRDALFHPHRDHAPRGLRVPGLAPPRAVPGDRRQEVRAHRAAGGGRAGGLRGRRH
jgi:GTP-binding protein